ncbi:hypothetical protein HYN49_11545 [Flavobacterium pallidum]|uniref:Uncharacterized protein n=1 Tax=Flavobacterium pallidum TaxID=2172098 RepID=A0A2S1SJ81_9FLAO|nr:hypothetical protein HYN49_11545 [Flavobacterium pallidum]
MCFIVSLTEIFSIFAKVHLKTGLSAILKVNLIFYYQSPLITANFFMAPPADRAIRFNMPLLRTVRISADIPGAVAGSLEIYFSKMKSVTL